MKTSQLVMIVFILSLMEMGASQCDVVRLAAAVRQILSPFMTEIMEDLAIVKNSMSFVKEDLLRIGGKIDSVSIDIEEHRNKTDAPTLYECGGTEDWRLVVYLDMIDSNCPSAWKLTSHSKRACGRVSTSSPSCDSVFFPVSGGNYTNVCGSIRAYQYSGTNAFEAYDNGRVTTIEGAYVAGVSLTHGSPRQHIWTFAAVASEAYPSRNDVCPCDASINIMIPPFVGTDYFCESADSSGDPLGNFYPDDPLWDGEGCGSSRNCCSFNNPPYFTKQLPSPTSDSIEARLCQFDTEDDSPVEHIELYVK